VLSYHIAKSKPLLYIVIFLFIRYDDLCCQKIDLLSSFVQIFLESKSFPGLKQVEVISCCLLLILFVVINFQVSNGYTVWFIF